jgi:hypothetical protein
MTPSKVRMATVVQKSALVDDGLRGLATLPMTDLEAFYDEVTTAELFDICVHRSGDIRWVRDVMLDWLRRHPELVDGEL